MFTLANLCLPLFIATSLVVAPAAAQSTKRVSVSSSGVQGDNHSLGPGVVASGGRYVSFTSNASNLVVADTNAHADAFVHDLLTGATTRVSVSSAGVQGNLSSVYPVISADGRQVAFTSTATNLIAADTNASDDVFVHDRQSGVTTRVSVDSSGAQANSDSLIQGISGNGRCVVFMSVATNLVPGDTNGFDDIFVRDLQTGTTTRVSVDSSGAQANNVSSTAAISFDGRYVAFASSATNLVLGDTNAQSDVFVRDTQTNTTTRVSISSAGVQGDAGSSDGIACPSISSDGNFVAFSSVATNLVAGDTNAKIDVFVRDRANAVTTRVSVDSLGAEADDACYNATISGDGNVVAFAGRATNLVALDTNGFTDVFVHVRATGATTCVSLSSSGVQGNSNSGASLPTSISSDGRVVAFESGASNLVPGDTAGNWDIFVRERFPAVPLVYCTAGTTTNGCTASISAGANPNLAHSTACPVTVTALEGQKTGIVFYGLTSQAQSWCALGGGTSVLCVKAPSQRTGVQSSGGTLGQCNGVLALDWNAFQLAHPLALGNPWAGGAKVYIQGWFRDPPSCKTTSLSNAVELTYQP